MKFKVSCMDYFSAAHNLRGYKGKCEALHGHNFKVKVSIGANNLDKAGMVCDFHYIKAQLKSVLNSLDHKHLNKLSFFKKVNPTSENIARFIFKQMKSKIIGQGRKLLEVTVWETQGNEASYQE